MTLDMLKKGEGAFIKELAFCKKDKKRLLDIGICEGAYAKYLFCAPFCWPRAYDIGGIVVALRKEEAEKIHCERRGGR